GRAPSEVGAGEPGSGAAPAAGTQDPPPPPRHRPDRADHDREREQPPAGARVAEDVAGLPEIDLPEDLGGAESGDDERQRDALHATASTRSVTNRIRDAAFAARASASFGVAPVARIAPARSEARRSSR